MSMLQAFKRRRRDAVDKRDIGLQKDVNKIMELYNASKTNDFGVLSIDPKTFPFRVVEAFWKRVQKDENAFLVYGITGGGEIRRLKSMNIEPDSFKYFNIGHNILTEIHFVRTSPKNIAQEICNMFSDASKKNPLNTNFVVEVSEISCFKYIKELRFLEFRSIRNEIEKLVGHIEIFNTFCWYDMYYHSLNNTSRPITRLRLTIDNNSEHNDSYDLDDSYDSDDSDDSEQDYVFENGKYRKA